MNEQGSAEWLADRCGMVTASRFADVLAKGQGKTRASYMRQVVAERLTGKPTESYKNAHMERGTEQEPHARMAYEAKTGNVVEEVGFIGELFYGCSPDGLIDLDGGAEIKSVIPTVQLDTILSGKCPTGHIAQIQGCMWVTGRQWWDFVSFSPDMPEPHNLYIYRVMRDEPYIATLALEVAQFIRDCDSMIEGLS